MDYEQTKKTHIVRGLRLIWMRSKERGAAMKRDKYTCQICHRKKSTKKIIDPNTQVKRIEVHHKNGITNWDNIIDLIRKEMLINPEFLITYCKECHAEVDNG